MKNCLFVCALIQLVVLLSISSLDAAPLTYRARGVALGVSDAGGLFPGVADGSPFVAIFGYDNDPGVYESITTLGDIPAENILRYEDATRPPSFVSLSIHVGGHLIDSAEQSVRRAVVSVGNDLGPDDAFAIEVTGDFQTAMTLFDGSGAAFADTGLPMSLDFDDFDDGDDLIDFDIVVTGQRGSFMTRARIDSIMLIPEPGTLLLSSLGGIGLVVGYRPNRKRT